MATRVNVAGKTSIQSHKFISKLKWKKQTTMSRLVGLAVDYAVQNERDFLLFVGEQMIEDKKRG